jgi:hypothetical protein
MKPKSLLLLTFTFVLSVLASCGGGGNPEGGIGGSGAPLGTLRMSITDAPSCGYDAVNITIEKVRVNQNASAGDSDAGWVDIDVVPAQRVDLLSLSNGVLLTLGETPLAAGKYTQMRLVLAANDSANPLANSVVPTGGAESPLTTPSAQQSGLKADVDIDVAANQLADFVIDFDACRSVVSAGNSGKYILKPVIDVVPNYISGVRGFVDLSVTSPETVVSLQQSGVVVKSTVPDVSGAFLLEPVAPGTYDLVVTAPGHATEVVRGVVVADSVVTDVDTSATAFDPPVSAIGVVAGVVTMTPVPVDASLVATQTLTGGTVIDVGALPADADTGAYGFELPVGAPQVATWTSAGGLVFAPDAGAAGHYTIQAAAEGATQASGLLTVTSGATVTANFTFP